MTDAQFDKIAADVWQKLLPIVPAELKAHFPKIQFVIENEPSEEVLHEIGDLLEGGDASSLCGLHIGVPLREESVISPQLLPTRVYLFRHAILDLAEYDGSAESLQDVRDEIAITLLHEVGHFFGLEEDDLERLGFD